jgi:flagellar protein FlaG
MINDTSNTTVTRLSSATNSPSRPNLNQETTKLAESEGAKLPVQGNAQPKESKGPTDIREAISEINSFVQNVQRDLSFNLDETSGRAVIQVVDRDSGDLIRQIPTEEVLAIATLLRDIGSNTTDQSEVPPGLLFSGST